MAREECRIPGPVRDTSPCAGCQRPQKRPGCHDRCKEFRVWKDKGRQVHKARAQYIIRTYANSMNFDTTGQKNRKNPGRDENT